MAELIKADRFKLDIVSRYLQGKIPRRVAIKALGISEETFRRYCRSYEKKGVGFLLHGNSGKRPHNRLSDALIEKIRVLVIMKYFDFNVTHLRQKLKEAEGICVGRETLRKLMSQMKMVKEPKRQRKARHRRDRMPQEGMMIQMDGSEHIWFGSKKAVLIAGIDDATSEVWGEFFWSEDTIGYMKLLKEIIQQRGVPEILYTDKAGMWSDRKRADFTQMRRACAELGISWIPAHSPQAKGRIERLFKTLQDRLVAEIRLRGITRIEEANRYLKTEFLPGQYFELSRVEPENPESAFRYISKEIDLDQILCMKIWRKVMLNHTITIKDKTYDVVTPDRICVAGHSVEIRTYTSGLTAAFYRNQRIELKEVKPSIKIHKGGPL